MTIESLIVPDLGGAEQVEVIEILVKAGDAVSAEESIIVLETDKATMEIPSPVDGTISSLSVSIGDKINEGDQYGEIETSAAKTETVRDEQTEDVSTEKKSEVDSVESSSQAVASEQLEIIAVPDLGGSDQVEVIELLVKVGENVEVEQSVLTLETDKASMEIPAGKAGRVEKILLTLGDKVSVGDAMIEIMVSSSDQASPLEASAEATIEAKAEATPVKAAKTGIAANKVNTGNANTGKVHAGPAVRKLAREFGVDLAFVKGNGVRGRITKDDVQDYVKSSLQNPQVAGAGLPKIVEIDFSKFGDIENMPLNKIKLATAKNMTAAWLNVPQVTQFDQADITDLEAFRKQVNSTDRKSVV